MVEEINLFDTDHSKRQFLTFRDMINNLGINKYSPDLFGKKLREYSNTHGSKIKTLSLFSGAGGLDIGFEDAGFDIIEQVEIVEEFSKTLKENNSKKHKVICKDIREYDGSHLKGKVDFIIGGPPCQPFSSAARRAFGVNGTIDARGTLFNEYVRVLKEIKPVGFLFENVYGIVSANKGEDWNIIVSAFKNVGYKLYYKILNAADYGTPQHRARLIIVGLRDNSHYKFPLPTHGPDSPDNMPYYTAGSALRGINTAGNMEKLKVTGKYGYLLDNIPLGMNYSYYTSKIGNPIAIFSWRSKFSDFLYKADPNQPIKTLKASGGQYTGPFHWNNRKFSIIELKRLQTIPDSYKLSGSRIIKIKQIGNSVPPQFARFLALSIRDQIFNAPIPFKLNFMDIDYKLSFNGYKRKLSRQYYKNAEAKLLKLKSPSTLKLKSHTSLVKLDERLNFTIVNDKADFKYKFSVNDDKSISIVMTDGLELVAGRKIVDLRINLSEAILNIYNKIKLKLYSQNPFAYTALWKALEYELSVNKIKGDLVQLNGYYQYPPKMNIEGQFSKEFCVNSDLMQGITRNYLTGKLMSLKEMAREVNMTTFELKRNLNVLKTIGYEVRNNNTNIQIPDGYWLIPYAFPTLSSLSVQKYKRL